MNLRRCFPAPIAAARTKQARRERLNAPDPAPQAWFFARMKTKRIMIQLLTTLQKMSFL
jgi:hypothetical protein